MELLSFSCLRPDPEHIGEVLGVSLNSPEVISEYLKSKVLTLDISRALYLCAYSDEKTTWKSLIACLNTEAIQNEATTDCGHKVGSYQTEPVRICYTTNMAIDVILGAATAAVPLYNVSNGNQHLVVWRISRAEAVEALQAAFASVDADIPATPYKVTMVELVDSADMPALPAGLFAHPIP